MTKPGGEGCGISRTPPADQEIAMGEISNDKKIAAEVAGLILEREGSGSDVRALMILAQRLGLYDNVRDLLRLREFLRRK